MSAANISALKPFLDEKNVTLLGLGVETVGYHDFVAGGFFAGELFVDEGKKTYAALNCASNTWRNLWGLLDGEIMRLFKLATAKGFENNMSGDKNQLGGTFVIPNGGGPEMYAHYQTSKSFEPDVRKIAESLGIALPADFMEYPAYAKGSSAAPPPK